MTTTQAQIAPEKETTKNSEQISVFSSNYDDSESTPTHQQTPNYSKVNQESLREGETEIADGTLPYGRILPSLLVSKQVQRAQSTNMQNAGIIAAVSDDHANTESINKSNNEDTFSMGPPPPRLHVLAPETQKASPKPKDQNSSSTMNCVPSNSVAPYVAKPINQTSQHEEKHDHSFEDVHRDLSLKLRDFHDKGKSYEAHMRDASVRLDSTLATTLQNYGEAMDLLEQLDNLNIILDKRIFRCSK